VGQGPQSREGGSQHDTFEVLFRVPQPFRVQPPSSRGGRPHSSRPGNGDSWLPPPILGHRCHLQASLYVGISLSTVVLGVQSARTHQDSLRPVQSGTQPGLAHTRCPRGTHSDSKGLVRHCPQRQGQPEKRAPCRKALGSGDLIPPAAITTVQLTGDGAGCTRWGVCTTWPRRPEHSVPNLSQAHPR
jgi:hypothetical protein